MKYKVLLLIGALLFIGISQAAAAPSTFEVFDRRTNKNINCKKLEGKWEPGLVNERSGKFTAFVKTIAKLNKKLQSGVHNRKALQSQVKTFTKNLKPQQRLCKGSAPKSGTPTATPTASGTVSPTATPTPSSGCQSCYDSGRNTKCFKIPSSLTGNESQGQFLFKGCTGSCHTESEHRNKDYETLKQGFMKPGMAPYSDYPSDALADLVAYLNRYNSKQCRSDWP